MSSKKALRPSTGIAGIVLAIAWVGAAIAMIWHGAGWKLWLVWLLSTILIFLICGLVEAIADMAAKRKLGRVS